MRNQGGFSLVEMVVITGLVAILAMVSAGIMNQFAWQQKSLAQKAESSVDLSLLRQVLQQTVLRSNITFRALTGKADQYPSGRYIIPRPGVCVDQVNKCRGSTSLQYISMRDREPSLPVICALNENRVVVDLSMTQFGELEYRSATQTVFVTPVNSLQRGGSLLLEENSVIALIDEPAALLVRMTGPPMPFNGNSSKSFQDNPDCLRNVNDPKKLLLLRINPLPIPTVNAEPSVRRVIAAYGEFPLRLTNVDVRAVGITTPDPKTKQQKISINNCLWKGGEIRCPDVFVEGPPVASVQILETLATPFRGASGVSSFSFTASDACVSPACEVMPYDPPLAVNLPDETPLGLRGGGFSLLKQDQILWLNIVIKKIEIVNGGERTRDEWINVFSL